MWAPISTKSTSEICFAAARALLKSPAWKAAFICFRCVSAPSLKTLNPGIGVGEAKRLPIHRFSGLRVGQQPLIPRRSVLGARRRSPRKNRRED